jgi:hypothetical protein
VESEVGKGTKFIIVLPRQASWCEISATSTLTETGYWSFYEWKGDGFICRWW